MRIEVSRKSTGLKGGPEVWVRVLSNEVVDWPAVAAKLDQGTRDLVAGATLTYYPHLVTAEERDEHDYRFEDWFTWAL